MSIDLVDAINTLSTLSRGISVDVVVGDEGFKAIVETIREPLWCDRGFLAALLTCTGAIGGSLYMGWKTMQATNESNKNQRQLALQKFDQDAEFKRLEIREKLASKVSMVSQMALEFEVDFESCISIGYPNWPQTEKEPPNIRNLRIQSVQKCLNSYKQLSLSYNELVESLNYFALYVSPNDIITKQIRELFNWYVDKAKELASETGSLWAYIQPYPSTPLIKANKTGKYICNTRELYSLTQEILQKLQKDEIKVVVPIVKLSIKS